MTERVRQRCIVVLARDIRNVRWHLQDQHLKIKDVIVVLSGDDAYRVQGLRVDEVHKVGHWYDMNQSKKAEDMIRALDYDNHIEWKTFK